MVALHGEIRVNHRKIGEWQAVCQPGKDGIHPYRWGATLNGVSVRGVLTHTRADGALVLASKVTAAAAMALAEATRAAESPRRGGVAQSHLATAQIGRKLGQRVIHVTMAEVTRGAGAHADGLGRRHSAARPGRTPPRRPACGNRTDVRGSPGKVKREARALKRPPTIPQWSPGDWDQRSKVLLHPILGCRVMVIRQGN